MGRGACSSFTGAFPVKLHHDNVIAVKNGLRKSDLLSIGGMTKRLLLWGMC